MLTAAAIAILGYLYKMAPAKMRIDSALEGTGIGYVASVAINFPLVLLFLALALLAFRQVQAPDILAAQEPDDLPPA
jgi:hypothetical protein